MNSFQDFQFNTNFSSQFDYGFTNLDAVRIDLSPLPAVRDNIKIVRGERTPEFEFRAKGKYTAQFLTNSTRPRGNLSAAGFGDFDFDNSSQNFCTTHKELKEFILYETIEEYRLYDTICKNCLSLLNFRKGGNTDYKSKLYDTVIIDNKDKLIQIRNNRFESGDNRFPEVNDILKDTIMPLIDELMYISEIFQEEVTEKLGGGGCNNHQFLKLKEFIERECGDLSGEINIKGIGKDIQKKHRLINLAVFLLKYLPNIKFSVTKKGISDGLKSHLLRIIEVRKIIVVKITSWLRYLTGPFYDYIFQVEGISMDENFRKSLQIEYVSEEEILRLKAYYEAELRKRDERIKFLEEENARLKRDLDAYKDQERIINELRFKLKQIENEYDNQKIQINSLQSENQRLTKLNGEYSIQIEQLKRDFSQMKIEFEQKLRSTLEQMKMECEKRINEINNVLSNLKIKYSELETKYNMDIRTLQSEKENLINNLNIIKQKFESEIKMYREQIESLQKENGNLKITINTQITQISQLSNERDQLKNTLEGLKIQITNLEVNIKNLTNQINIITKERDELRNHLNIYIQEINSLKMHIENYKNQISQYELNIKNFMNQITLITKERDELKYQINIIIQERDSLRNQFENLKSQISIFEQNIKTLTVNINVLTKERDEARNQLNILRGELEKVTGEIKMIQNIKITLEARLSEIQRKYDDMSEGFRKLQNEYNLKIQIISNLEAKIRELNVTLNNFQNQITMHITMIKKLQEELEDIKKKYQELLDKDIIISQKDLEIESLKRALCDCRDEWYKLSESYEGILKDAKTQIVINEALRMFIAELQGKIETHNQQISGLDAAIKQQLEILTRQTLSKKNIEFNQNNDTIRKSQNEIEALRSKISRIETQKLTKSAVFVNIDKILNNFDKNFSGKIIPLSPVIASNDFSGLNTGFNLVNNIRPTNHTIDINVNSFSGLDGFRPSTYEKNYGLNVFKKYSELDISSNKKIDASDNFSDKNSKIRKSVKGKLDSSDSEEYH